MWKQKSLKLSFQNENILQMCQIWGGNTGFNNTWMICLFYFVVVWKECLYIFFFGLSIFYKISDALKNIDDHSDLYTTNTKIWQWNGLYKCFPKQLSKYKWNISQQEK